MASNSIISVLVDNLRIDSLSEKDFSKKFFPNFLYLKKNGIFKEIISNSNTTKFVMPSIFTQSYPLDYGGYNSVISQRPKSFVELIRNQGFKTIMVQGDENDGPMNNCERGFESISLFYDYRILIYNLINRNILYDIGLWEKKIISNTDIKATLKKKLKPVLQYLYESKNRLRNSNHSKWHKKADKKLKTAILSEIELINKEPILIAKKILRINPAFYISSLGEGINFSIILKIRYFFFKLKQKFDGILKFCFPNFTFFKPQKSVLVDDIFDSIKSKIPKKDKFFIYSHIMDLHDRGYINRPIRFLQKLSLWPKWILNKKTNRTFKRFLYDISLHFIDKELGKLIELSRLKSYQLFIFGDHGCDIHDIDQRNFSEIFGFRTHREHINVPLIIYNSNNKINNEGFHDSMSISATILDELNIKPHKSFKGRSVYKIGKKIIISENCGRGNCDVERKDLYFTITSKKYKMFVLIQKNKIKIKRLYDLVKDIDEINNLINLKSLKKEIKTLLSFFINERKDLLKKRKIKINLQNLNNYIEP